MVTIEDAITQAMRTYLAMPGIVGIGRSDNTIVFYVETQADATKVPKTYAGYPTTIKVTGKVRLM